VLFEKALFQLGIRGVNIPKKHQKKRISKVTFVLTPQKVTWRNQKLTLLHQISLLFNYNPKFK